MRWSISSSVGITSTSGRTPTLLISVPLGVSHSAMLTNKAPPSLSWRGLLTVPLPKLVSPTLIARPFSTSADTSTSEALALNRFCNITIGTSEICPFFATWFAQSVTDWTTYNSEQLDHQEQTVSWLTYIATSDFWEKTLQNWQSEFLAVGTMAAFTIYLRQRGSPESKPVGAPHDETGSSV